MSLTSFQINPIDVNFYLQKSLECFDKNSEDKIWSKKGQGDKGITHGEERVHRWKFCDLKVQGF